MKLIAFFSTQKTKASKELLKALRGFILAPSGIFVPWLPPEEGQGNEFFQILGMDIIEIFRQLYHNGDKSQTLFLNRS